MIECKNVSAGYGETNILNNITLKLIPGEVLAIIGPNGCGKSTLLKVITGIIRNNKGDILFDGNSILDMSEKEIARKVSFLTQSRDTPNILSEKLVLHGRFPWLNVPRHYSNKDIKIAEESMQKTGCYELRGHNLTNLSGGQRQKIYLAMNIAQNTSTILMDEPTTYLDINNQLQTLKEAKKMAAEGKSVVVVIHDIPQALIFADKIAVMDKGKIVAYGTSKQIIESNIIEDVFHIRLMQADTTTGTRYFIEINE